MSQILQKNNENSELRRQIGPRLRKLEEDFKHSGGRFEVKKLDELFDVSTSKSTDKNKLTFVSKEQGIQFI